MAALRSRPAFRGGLSTVEMALVLPLVLLLTLSLMEYGWLFLKAEQITNATRQGARVGARAYSTGADVDATIATLMETADLADSGYVVTISPPAIEELESGQLISVTVRVPYDNIGLGMPLTPTPAALESSVSMVREGI